MFVLTNVQLRSIFEEHKLRNVWNFYFLKHLPFSIKFNFSIIFPMHFPDTPSYLYVSSYFFSWELLLPVALFPQLINFSCILLSVWLIFNTMFLNWKLITLVLLTWVVILLAESFDNFWNSMEYVINLDDIWRYLWKTFEIWVERYLAIFNDNLAIFDDRNVHTGARK